MSRIIAVSGKGGVGKSTIASLIVSQLITRQKGPILAVDADPNACLEDLLGVTVSKTVGGVREEAKEIAGKGMASGITKQQLLELKIAESVVEALDFDLIAMGRPEGPGCYCYANNVLKSVLSNLSSQYPYTVLDNEAGLENLSRRIVQDVDLLITVTDPSLSGIKTVKRLHDLTREMGITYKYLAVIINRLRKETLPESALDLKTEMGADLVIGLPDDVEIASLAEKGETIFTLPKDSQVLAKMAPLLNLVA
jgi:CO dehydrogenase maturation factor